MKKLLSLLLFFSAMAVCFTSCGESQSREEAVAQKIENGEALEDKDYEVVYTYYIDRIKKVMDAASDGDEQATLEAMSDETADRLIKAFEKVIPQDHISTITMSIMLGVPVKASDFVKPSSSVSDAEEVAEEVAEDRDESIEGLAMPDPEDVGGVEEIDDISEEVDSMLLGIYEYYAGNDETPMGRKIKSLGATEISQGRRSGDDWSFNYMALPARLARDKKVNERPIDKVMYILADDIVRYFGLEKTYDTPLKEKNFKTNEEFKWFHDEFKAVKEMLKNQMFFVCFPIDSDYDMETGTFNVKFPMRKYCSRTEDKANQLSIGVFMNPKSSWFTNSTVNVKVDENVAMKIEENRSSLIFMGRFEPELGYYSERFKSPQGIIFTPVEMFIANDSTGEIYLEKTL